MATTNKRLQEFKGSGFEMVKGQPNIIGWQVISADGHKLGKITELIIDTVAQRVRYMVVALTDNKILQLEKRTVLVPVGFAQLHPADDCVVLTTVTPYQLRALPRYDRTHLGPKSEIDISQVFGREHSALGSDIGEPCAAATSKTSATRKKHAAKACSEPGKRIVSRPDLPSGLFLTYIPNRNQYLSCSDNQQL
ncbi:MAG: hypothetical protein EOO16_05535 [Chitinophagaceae bacterium]|nr:MAG: hypothetical protein EOO16_05535 [Chitinophagaceae bacterium]